MKKLVSQVPVALEDYSSPRYHEEKKIKYQEEEEEEWRKKIESCLLKQGRLYSTCVNLEKWKHQGISNLEIRIEQHECNDLNGTCNINRPLLLPWVTAGVYRLPRLWSSGQSGRPRRSWGRTFDPRGGHAVIVKSLNLRLFIHLQLEIPRCFVT